MTKKKSIGFGRRPPALPGEKLNFVSVAALVLMTGAFCEPCDDNNRYLAISRIRDRTHAPVGELVCGHLPHASRPTSHVAVYSAYLSIPKGRRRGRGQAEHRSHSVTLNFPSLRDAVYFVMGELAPRARNGVDNDGSRLTYNRGNRGAIRPEGRGTELRP